MGIYNVVRKMLIHLVMETMHYQITGKNISNNLKALKPIPFIGIIMKKVTLL